MFGFENLAEVILRKNDGELLLRRLQGRMAHIEEIRAQREMRAVFFKNAKRQQTSALGLLDGVAKVRCGQLFPLHRKLGLRMYGTSSDQRYKQRTDNRMLHG